MTMVYLTIEWKGDALPHVQQTVTIPDGTGATDTAIRVPDGWQQNSTRRMLLNSSRLPGRMAEQVAMTFEGGQELSLIQAIVIAKATGAAVKLAYEGADPKEPQVVDLVTGVGDLLRYVLKAEPEIIEIAVAAGLIQATPSEGLWKAFGARSIH